MNIYLQNTLTKKKDIFMPIKDGEVGLYTCGPTVYNFAHIGNLRSFIFADILKRTLTYNGYNVKHIMNVTDIGHLSSDADEGEDKMVNALKREGKPMTLNGLKEVGQYYFTKLTKDFDKLNILPADIYPYASDELPAQIELINKLLAVGYAYKISDGIYFDTKKLLSYGRLGKSTSDDYSRVGVNTEKRNIRDFALWKFSDEGGIGFEATFGRGFPGWHIECSAMSMKYLGEQFDIHTGGIDHIQVHHNNEIAQSEAATGKILANYWLHNEHLTISKDKMAKSGDNFITLKTLEEKGIAPFAYRYYLLTSRYSTRMDFSFEALNASQTSFARLTAFLREATLYGTIHSEYREKFLEAINNDLDTPKAIALMWDIIKDENVSLEDKKATILDFDKVLGLGLGGGLTSSYEKFDIPKDVEVLLEKRKIAKESRDFALSDHLRKTIENKGFSIKDERDGLQSLNKI